MKNVSRTALAITVFAMGASLHCGSTSEQNGEIGVNFGDGGVGHCDPASPDRSGCPCTQGQTVACYSGPPSTRGVGSCHDGVQTCTAGALQIKTHILSGPTDNDGYGPCQGEVLPSAADSCTAGDAGASPEGGPVEPVTCPGALTKWVAMSTVGAPPSMVAGPPLVWTGKEVMVFGGRDNNDLSVEGGWLYNPKTDSWRPMSKVGAPIGRIAYGALWTGSRILLWGGIHDSSGAGSISSAPVNDGAIYDPVADAWESIPSPQSQGMGVGTTGAEAVIGWTGTELVLLGSVGWFYNPTTKAWRIFGSGLGVQTPAVIPAMLAWTGNAALIWGEHAATGAADGGRYTDTTGKWTPLAPSPLSGRSGSEFVWTGTQVFVHGGRSGSSYPTDGAMYDPARDIWTALPSGGGERFEGVTVWTGCDVLEVGGFGSTSAPRSTGIRYTPATKTWTPLPALPTRFLGDGDGAVWAGDQLVVFGSGGNQVGGMFTYRLVQ